MKNKFLILMCAILLLSVFSIANISATWTSNLDNGLVAFYNFKEGSGTSVADATGQHTGYLEGAGTTWIQGKLNGGISFDGVANESMHTLLNKNFTQTTPTSFSFWWKGDIDFIGNQFIGVNNEFRTAGDWVGAWNGLNVQAVDTNGFRIEHGAYNNKYGDYDNAFLWNNWTHFVVIYNGTLGTTSTCNFDVYMNGIKYNLQNCNSGTPSYQANYFTLGNFYGNGVAGTFRHKGNFSLVALYNRTLNSSEVEQLYNNGAGLDYPQPAYNVQFVTPTDINNYGYQRQFILVNVTAENFGAGLSNITIRFYNSSRNQIASVNQASSPLYYNYSTGVDGNFYFNATACDINNVCNSTETRLVRLDTNNPVVNIEYPVDLKVYGTNIDRVTFTALNTGTITDCWIILNNNGTNISVPNCTHGANMTYTGFTSLEGTNTIEVWAKDIVNLTGSHSHLYAVDTTSPTIAIIFPNNTNKTSLVTELKYSYNDTYSGYCWYSNNSGVTNSTPVIARTNFTGVSTSNGANTLRLYCNDSVGNLATTSVSFNINIPIVVIPPAYQSNSIYQLLNSAGAGLGSFIQVISFPLFILLLLVGFVAIIVIIGYSISQVLKRGLIGRK